jgi:peptide-methionine (S)-S-oxide reductase
MSAIFYHDEEQKELAEKTKAELSKTKKISTQILKAGEFTVAEDYHQKYMLQHHPWLCEAIGVDPGEALVQSNVAARLNGYIGGYGNINTFEAEAVKIGLNEKMMEYVIKQMKSKY